MVYDRHPRPHEVDIRDSVEIRPAEHPAEVVSDVDLVCREQWLAAEQPDLRPNDREPAAPSPEFGVPQVVSDDPPSDGYPRPHERPEEHEAGQHDNAQNAEANEQPTPAPR